MSYTSEIVIDFLEKNIHRHTFLEHEIKGLFKKMGFSVPRSIFIPKEGEFPPIDLKYPLVAKVSSTLITSKSDVKGLRIGIKDEAELVSAFRDLINLEFAEGVLIEELAPPGIEVIVGGIVDEQFGPIVMFGLGGFFVELYKDVSFGLAPLNKDDAIWLIKQVKCYKILEGFRQNEPLDIDSLIKIVIAVSETISTNRIKEIDLNPIRLYPKGLMIIDAKMQAISNR